MRVGKSLVELATEIQRQADAKRDYVVPAKASEVVVQEHTPAGATKPVTDIRLNFGDQSLAIGPTAHEQIGSALSIPKAYYDRMKAEQPDLLATNINRWLSVSNNSDKRLVRTLDGTARAFLSDKYRPLDNVDLAEAVLPVFQNLNLELISAEVTDKKLYLKAIDADVVKELPQGAKLGQGHQFIQLRKQHPLVTITNSEIGHGSLSISTGVFDRFCTNLAIFEKPLRKNHVGSRNQFAGEFTDEAVYAMLSDKTKQLNDAAIWATVTDVLKNAFSPEAFETLINKIRGTQDQAIEGDIPKVVEVTAKRFGFNDGERKSVLDHLIKGADLSRFGLYNAITRTAEDVVDYDRASEFERFGAQIIELPSNDWEQLAKAA